MDLPYRRIAPRVLDQAQELPGYHRKATIQSLRAPTIERGPLIITGRPVTYEPRLLLPYLRPIRQATDYAYGRRLVAMDGMDYVTTWVEVRAM